MFTSVFLCYNLNKEGGYMKILFLGDSITEGNPGVSYVDQFKKETSHQCINRGKGGDTVSSLYRRVKAMDDLASYDRIVLFVGINDVFGQITLIHKIFKYAKRQVWAKDLKSFIHQYRVLLEFLIKKNAHILILPPLLIGEDISNPYNQTLVRYREGINELATTYSVGYIDAYKKMVDYLEDKSPSNYLPLSLIEIYQDTKLDSSQMMNTSLKRGLFLTIDGVHLNEVGASMITSLLKEAIKKG